MSCQLYRSLGKEVVKKPIKHLDREHFRVNEDHPAENVKNKINDDLTNDNLKEVEIDFEEILTLLINVQSLKPVIN